MKKILRVLLLLSVVGIVFSALMPTFNFSYIEAFNVFLSSIVFFTISTCSFVTSVKSPSRLNFALILGGIIILLFPLVLINSELHTFFSIFILGLIVIQVVKTIDLFLINGVGFFNVVSRVCLWIFTLLILIILMFELSNSIVFNVLYGVLSIGTISVLIHSFKNPLIEK